VGDGDNFRLYHTPGGRLLGWGWFPGRKVPTDPKELRQRTVGRLQLASYTRSGIGFGGFRVLYTDLVVESPKVLFTSIFNVTYIYMLSGHL